MGKRDFKSKAMKFLRFIANPRLLLCLALAWMITNGWSYVLLGVGTYYGIGWMIAVSSAYLAFLWLPVTPEKILTVAIAISLLKLMFPKDQKTLGVLTDLAKKVTGAAKKLKEKNFSSIFLKPKYQEAKAIKKGELPADCNQPAPEQNEKIFLIEVEKRQDAEDEPNCKPKDEKKKSA